MPHYNDKVVWITGASSGIGEALALRFAKAGAKLVLSARRETELQRVKGQTGLANDRVFVLPLDLLDYNSMPGKTQAVLDHFGRIDVLINNGGISQRSLVNETELSVYQRLMDVNFIGTVALTKAVLPVFLKQGKGQFGVITSLMGKFASPLRSGYAGAKHALHGFFDALRMEYEDQGVKVTLLCPGFIKTNISLNALTADGSAQQKMDEKQAQGMTAEDCAEQIFRAMEKEKMEAYIGGKETFAVYLKRFFPGWLHRVVKRAAVR